MKAVDLVAGQKFGEIEVIKKDHTKIVYYGKRKLTKDYYLCRCKCGKEFIAYKHNLTRNIDRIESCCCKKGKHHLTNTRCMRIFYGMKKRCFDKKCVDYKNYGGRGITICNEWINEPELFYDWAMENGYNDRLTIDRIDVNKGYCPENCRWITRTEQNSNKRNVKKVKCVETGKIYISVADAKRDTGANDIVIGRCLKGLGKTAGGYHWRYADDLCY